LNILGVDRLDAASSGGKRFKQMTTFSIIVLFIGLVVAIAAVLRKTVFRD
jgi:hypothetical protein